MRNGLPWNCLGYLASMKISDKDQIDAIWRGTDTCRDFALEFLGPANYDSYEGNKLKDIISESIEWVYTDIKCCVEDEKHK